MESVITESMYAACGDSGDDYLMMDSIGYYQNNYNTITFPDQKVVHRGRSFMWRSTVGWKL